MQSRTERKDAQLRRMKNWAGALFLFMLCVYAVAHRLEAHYPALFFVVTLSALNFFGDGLRDAFDPKDR